jgi:adenylate kinase
MSTFLILLGAPGAGKGTQARGLMTRLGLPQVSSGDLFREALKERTPLGVEAAKYIDRGELVPDAVTIGMVAERLARPDCAGGAILDGFPRTIEQAKALDGALAQRGAAINRVFYIKVSSETLLKRLGGRWICRDCGAMYHSLYNPPRAAGRCDACGGELYQREDDAPETHRKRIEVYDRQTAPLIEYYQKRGLLVEIDGEADIAGVQAQLLRAVQHEAGPVA